MSLTDPVADFLARIRNAINARHQKVDVPPSKLKTGDCPHSERRRLHREFQADGRRRPEGAARVPEVRRGQQSPISNVKRISRPGCRVYVGTQEIPRVLGGLGINILTTPKGVMTGRQARKEGVGGEVLCEIY